MNCVQLTQSRDQLRAVLNTTVDPGVIKGGGFLYQLTDCVVSQGGM